MMNEGMEGGRRGGVTETENDGKTSAVIVFTDKD